MLMLKPFFYADEELNQDTRMQLVNVTPPQFFYSEEYEPDQDTRIRLLASLYDEEIIIAHNASMPSFKNFFSLLAEEVKVKEKMKKQRKLPKENILVISNSEDGQILQLSNHRFYITNGKWVLPDGSITLSYKELSSILTYAGLQ